MRVVLFASDVRDISALARQVDAGLVLDVRASCAIDPLAFCASIAAQSGALSHCDFRLQGWPGWAEAPGLRRSQ